jgi:hypothetical protein
VNDFQLTEADKSTGLWLRLKAHLETRLTDVRQLNDRAQSEHETAALRGEIRCLKQLIRLDASRPLTGDEE